MYLVSGDAGTQERLTAALAPGVRLRCVANVAALPQRMRGGDVLLATMETVAGDGETLRRLRHAWCVVIVYRAPELLEVAQVFTESDGWADIELFAQRPREIVTLASNGYAILPSGLDMRFGLDDLRFKRLARLSTRDRAVVAELVSGATNRDIAQRLGLTEDAVANSLRRSMATLCVRSRLQAALLLARHERLLAARPPAEPANATEKW